MQLIATVLFYFWNKWRNPLQKEKKTIGRPENHKDTTDQTS
jgi:uncharacterized membrane protein